MVLAFISRGKIRIAVVILLALIVGFWRALDWKYGITGDDPARFFARTDIQVDAILWGVAIALLSADETYSHVLRKAAANRWAILAAIMFALISAFAVSGNWKIDFAFLTLRGISIPFAILGTTILYKSAASRVLESTPIVWIGWLSYSLYLWQELFLPPDTELIQSFEQLQRFPVNLLAAIVCAVASYYLIEKPFIKLGTRCLNLFRATQPSLTAPDDAIKA